jgi:hypothetical protein
MTLILGLLKLISAELRLAQPAGQNVIPGEYWIGGSV